jgi:hypothetical protein
LGGDEAVLLHDIALAYYRAGQMENAIQAASDSAAKSSDEAFQASNWYLIADAQKKLWNFGQGDETHFTEAAAMYRSFLNVGSPKYKAKSEIKSYEPPEEEYARDEKMAFIAAYRTGSSDPCAAILSALWARKVPDQDYGAMLNAITQKRALDPGRYSRSLSVEPSVACNQAALRIRACPACEENSRLEYNQAADLSKLRLMITSAICTVLSAAPLRRLSETTQKERPLSRVWSSRMRLT